MCRLRLVVLAASLHALTSARGDAQDLREYERRVDALAEMSRAAAARRADFEHTLEIARKGHDTVQAGPVRLLAFDSTTIRARAALPQALSSITPSYGRALEVLRRHTFLMRTDTTAASGGSPERPRLVVAELDHHGKEKLMQWIEPDSAVLVRVLVNAMLAAIGVDTDPTFRDWLSAWLPRDTVRAEQWIDARITLLSSISTEPRRCYEGVVASCRVALGMEAVADPATQLFDSAGRYRHVAQDDRWLRRANAIQTDACLANSDRACIALIRRWAGDMGPPHPASLRGMVAQYAAAVGGVGAMERMLDVHATPAERLSAAARMPIDTLLARWVGEIHRRRAPNENMTPMVAVTSIGWLLFCAGMVTRSSRWR